MLGVGAAEILILIAIAVLLFGAPVLTFIVGYSLGKKKAGSESTEHVLPATQEERSDQ
jgi:Sec-independent protein translocase protein TatA